MECGQGTWGGGDTAVRMGLDPGDTGPSQALIRGHGGGGQWSEGRGEDGSRDLARAPGRGGADRAGAAGRSP